MRDILYNNDQGKLQEYVLKKLDNDDISIQVAALFLKNGTASSYKEIHDFFWSAEYQELRESASNVNKILGENEKADTNTKEQTMSSKEASVALGKRYVKALPGFKSSGNTQDTNVVNFNEYKNNIGAETDNKNKRAAA